MCATTLQGRFGPSALAAATIATPRLVLRPFEPGDARRIAYLAGDYEVARMCGRVPHPYALHAALDWIDLTRRQRTDGCEYPFAVTAELDGLIGACGVTRLADEPDSPWELGYWFGLPYWGAGYATEAAGALMDWARDALGVRLFAAGHFADNPASGRVLRKLGFVAAGPDQMFGLARQRVSPVERYVWPEGAAPVKLADHALAPR